MRRFVLALLTGLTLASAGMADTVTVFAASSLKSALDVVAADWLAATGNMAVLSYGGSGAMAQQIRQGAPADVFVSANPEWMDLLAGEGLVDADSRVNLLGNRLVLIGPVGAAPLDIGAGIRDRLGDGRLAVGQTASVPAGIYARAALEKLGLWDALAPRLVETEYVSAAARLVALGEAPLGIVYASDVTGQAGVVELAAFPAASHPAIVYPAAALTGAPEVARDFVAFLQTPAARAVFEANGFTGPPQ